MNQATFLVNNLPINKLHSTNLDNFTNTTSTNTKNTESNNNVKDKNVIITSKKPTKIVENVYYL
jgi:hypothetical protein